jgi:TonB family protein
MTPLPSRIASGLVLTWTRLYTWGMPPAARDARHAEVESDLWESAHDPDGARSGAEVSLVWLLIVVTLRVTPRPPSPPAPPKTLHAGLIGSATVPAPPPPPPPPPGWAKGDRAPHYTQPQYGETSFTVAPGTPAPVRVKDVRPVYPPIAAAYELRGTVILEAIVDERGRAVQPRILRSIPVLDHSVLNALRQWEFQPAVVDGAPQRAVITVTARFGGAMK